MERLTIDEIIECCERKTKLYEEVNKRIDFETLELKNVIKEYRVHKQVKEYLKELKRYRDLEEQGLLLRLPCKVGSTLYQPISNRINEYKTIGLCFDINRNKFMYEVAYQIGLEWYKTTCDFDCINKTVFLTQAEAEQKLKEMKDK